MRVLYIIDDLRTAGAQKHLARLLQGLGKTKFQPFVFAVTQGGEVEKELRSGGVPVETLGLRTIYDIRVVPALLRLIRFILKHRIDIVHGYLLLGDILAVAASLCTNARVITTRRELGISCKHSHVLAYRILNMATDRIVVVSNAVREFCISQEGISRPEKLVVVHNGVGKDELAVQCDASDMRAQLGISTDRICIAVVANLLPIKGHAYFLQAMRKLQEKRHDLIGLLVGTGPYRGYLERLAVEVGVANTVLFLGQRDDVADILNSADIFVLPSIAEGMSNAILEAMLMSKPVISTNSGGTPEIIEHGVSGLIVEPCDPESLAEAIDRLATNKAERQRLGKNARVRAEACFSVAAMCRRMEDVYVQSRA